MHELLHFCDYNAGNVWVCYPETYPRNILLISCSLDSPERSPLASYLLLDPEDEKGIDFEFISEAVKRFDEDENIKPAFITAVEELSAGLSSQDVNGDYKPYCIVRWAIRFT